jgi:AraC family ethanolamine operon transcriptional activator
MDVLAEGCANQSPHCASQLVRLNLTDPADMTGVIQDGHWEIDQLQPGEFYGSTLLLQFEPLCIARLNINRAALHRLRCSPHGYTVLVRGRGSSEIFVASHPLQPSDCVLLQSGSEIDILSRGEAAIVVVSVRGVATAALHAASGGRPLPIRGWARVLSGDSNPYDEIPACIERAETIFRESEQRPSAATQASLARQLLASIQAATSGTALPEGSASRPIRRRIAVERARNYIREHLSEPIKLADLCQHAHVQERSLEYGFREIVGLRPMAYIKMLRLCNVRRRLLTGNYLDHNISQLALDSGLTHLGQFAIDYKRLFRESPSTTRNRARALYQVTISHPCACPSAPVARQSR